jgi:sec-independent protein translocase protein TatA
MKRRCYMGNLGTSELLLIVLVVVIFFGGKKIPEIAQGLGKGIREFRKAAQEGGDDADSEAGSSKPSKEKK